MKGYEFKFSMTYQVKAENQDEAENIAVDLFATDIGDSYGNQVKMFVSETKEINPDEIED